MNSCSRERVPMGLNAVAGNHALPRTSISVISSSSFPKSHHSRKYNQAIKHTCQQIIRLDLLEFQGFIAEESSAFDLFVLVLRSLLVLHIKHCTKITQYSHSCLFMKYYPGWVKTNFRIHFLGWLHPWLGRESHKWRWHSILLGQMGLNHVQQVRKGHTLLITAWIFGLMAFTTQSQQIQSWSIGSVDVIRNLRWQPRTSTH